MKLTIITIIKVVRLSKRQCRQRISCYTNAAMNIDVRFNWYHRMHIFKSGIYRLVLLEICTNYFANEYIFQIYLDNLFHENFKQIEK